MITCNKYSGNTMKIWFNFAISTVFAIVVVVSLTSAKSVLQKPITDNQSRPDKLSVKQSSDIHSTKSYIDNVEKSTTVDRTKAMSPSNTTAVLSSADITSEMYTSNNISATTSVEDTNKAQVTKIASVKTITEDKIILKFQKNKTIYLNTTHKPKTRYSFDLISVGASIIRFEEFPCPDGLTKNAIGECEPMFSG